MPKEELLKLYHKYRFYLFQGLVGIVGLLIVILVIGPQLVSFVNNQQALQKTSQKYNTLSEKLSQLQSLDQSQLKKQTDTALLALPEEKDYSKILGLVQSIASINGYVVLNFQLGSNFTTSASGAQGFSFKVELAGPTASFKTLLASLESSTPIMRISGIDLNNAKNLDRLEGVLTIDTFYSNLPKTIGAVDAPLPQLTAEDLKTLDNYLKLAAVVPVSTFSGTISIKGKSNPFE